MNERVVLSEEIKDYFTGNYKETIRIKYLLNKNKIEFFSDIYMEEIPDESNYNLTVEKERIFVNSDILELIKSDEETLLILETIEENNEFNLLFAESYIKDMFPNTYKKIKKTSNKRFLYESKYFNCKCKLEILANELDEFDIEQSSIVFYLFIKLIYSYRMKELIFLHKLSVRYIQAECSLLKLLIKKINEKLNKK